MTNNSLKVADLSEKDLADIRALEDEIGTTIVAYQPESPFALLDDDKLRRLRELEQSLGVVLLAYKR